MRHVAKIPVTTTLWMLAALVGVAWGGTAPAFAQPNFYKGKTITFIVGQPPGGSTSPFARIIARYLAKHIAGAPNTVVENMVGAGSLRATNYVSNVAPEDGTYIGVIGTTIPFAPLLGVEQAHFDATKLNWLPSPDTDVAGLTLWHTSPVNSVEDARHHEVVLASANAFSTSSFYARILTAVLGVKLKLIYGYNGIEPAFLAMERGEVEGHPSASWESLEASHPDWIRDKKIKVIVQYGRAPNPEEPHVPFLPDLVHNDADRRLVDVSMAPLAIGKPFFVGAHVPPDRVAILRKALLETYRDKALLADAARVNVDFAANPMSGEEVQALVRRTYAAPEPVLDRLRKLYQAQR